jgi:hypothetical protein
VHHVNSADDPFFLTGSSTWLLIARYCMSCPIHNHCTGYAASIPYDTPMVRPSTTTIFSPSLELVPQANNIFVGYESGAPLPTSPIACPSQSKSRWYPFDAQHHPASHSGGFGGNIHGTVPLQNSYSYHPEPRAHFHELVCFTISYA